MTTEHLPLRSLQEWFVRVTTEEESALAGLKRHAHIVAPEEIERVVRPGPRSSALDRLGIYHHSYFARLIECLADDYPALRFALGESAFDDLCREYIDAFPSQEPNLNGFGRNFVRFLKDNQRGSWQFEAELAALEWALVEVLHARAPERIRPDALESIAPHMLPNVRFGASPSARILSFEYPVNAFLQAFFRKQQPSKPAPQSSSIVVVRTGYEIWRLGLSSVAAQVLRRLFDGQPLGQALGDIAASPDQVQSWFRDWTTHGVFEHIVVPQ